MASAVHVSSSGAFFGGNRIPADFVDQLADDQHSKGEYQRRRAAPMYQRGRRRTSCRCSICRLGPMNTTIAMIVTPTTITPVLVLNMSIASRGPSTTIPERLERADGFAERKMPKKAPAAKIMPSILTWPPIPATYPGRAAMMKPKPMIRPPRCPATDRSVDVDQVVSCRPSRSPKRWCHRRDDTMNMTLITVMSLKNNSAASLVETATSHHQHRAKGNADQQIKSVQGRWPIDSLTRSRKEGQLTVALRFPKRRQNRRA